MLGAHYTSIRISGVGTMSGGHCASVRMVSSVGSMLEGHYTSVRISGVRSMLGGHSASNIKSARPTKQLPEKWLGPFPNLKKVSTQAYHLKLQSKWKSIHPVFHISLLEPVKTSKMTNRHQEPPPLIIIEEEEEWEVSQTLESKLNRGDLWYLVDWKGFSQDSERSTWE
ncbi:hypothetical protein O181_107269 [Austropuccinia psidii MF-1]|uniref:Chromo domain-containing protein n=1 Tax=Austropuccinia psidii MF-1 TaxID=1389203 RepID=A0A9Q3JST6_9BASI|nr:hypothetical protein [Austropuccinia psidii MF-1]